MGSNPTISFNLRLAQSGSARDLGSRGLWFKSRISDCGRSSVVERLAVDEFGIGSIPIGRHAGVAQRQSKRLVSARSSVRSGLPASMNRCSSVGMSGGLLNRVLRWFDPSHRCKMQLLGGVHMEILFLEQLIGYGCFIAILLTWMYFGLKDNDSK